MPTEQEKKEALARLASGDVASLNALGLRANADQDLVDAMSRVIADLNVPIMLAKHTLDALERHLQESDLTINFQAYKFFNSAPSGTGYVSQFAGGNKWGGDSYISARDAAEEAMFDYSGTRGQVAPAAVHQRVKQTGKLDSDEFVGSMRPKYAALNYAQLPHGSASQWGKSFVVLKEHVKHNATFVHTDSFDEAGSARQRASLGGKVANFINMHRLIVNMPLAMLTALNQARNGLSFGDVTQVPGLGDTAYVEAHIHAGVEFNRDLEKIVISRGELADSEAKTRALHSKDKKRWKVRSSKKLSSIFEKFCKKHGIKLEYAT